MVVKSLKVMDVIAVVTEGTNGAAPHPSPVVPRRWGASATIAVGVVDDHEMFALGLRTCLAGNPLVKVLNGPDDEMDVVIVSPAVAAQQRFACPLVVCGDPPSRVAPGNVVLAVLPRSTLTAGVPAYQPEGNLALNQLLISALMIT